MSVFGKVLPGGLTSVLQQMPPAPKRSEPAGWVELKKQHLLVADTIRCDYCDQFYSTVAASTFKKQIMLDNLFIFYKLRFMRLRPWLISSVSPITAVTCRSLTVCHGGSSHTDLDFTGFWLHISRLPARYSWEMCALCASLLYCHTHHNNPYPPFALQLSLMKQYHHNVQA